MLGKEFKGGKFENLLSSPSASGIEIYCRYVIYLTWNKWVGLTRASHTLTSDRRLTNIRIHGTNKNERNFTKGMKRSLL